jgi:thiol-disulfide isomerase/thioredoxin
LIYTTLLVFWATWCGPCVYEIPFLKKIHEKYPEINLVSLSEDKDLDKLNAFIKTNKMDWTQLRIDRNVKHDFNVDAIPVSILIDEHGVFKNIHIGGLIFEDYEKFIFVK